MLNLRLKEVTDCAICAICLISLGTLRSEDMPCEINSDFLDSNFSKEETIRYFGLDFWQL